MRERVREERVREVGRGREGVRGGWREGKGVREERKRASERDGE